MENRKALPFIYILYNLFSEVSVIDGVQMWVWEKIVCVYDIVVNLLLFLITT